MGRTSREPTGLLVETHGPVRVLRIDRPHRRNALGVSTLEALAEEGRNAREDRAVRALVLTGTGDFFIAGGDLREFSALDPKEGGARVHELGAAALRALRRAGVLLLAAVNGDAYGGGCELAAACDLRVLSRSATLHWVQGRLGLTTGWGGAARLVQLVGSATALRWLLGAAAVPAEEALQRGFADRVCDPESALTEALELALELTALERATARRMLRLVRVAEAHHRAADRRVEHRAFAAAWTGSERRAAMERFKKR